MFTPEPPPRGHGPRPETADDLPPSVQMSVLALRRLITASDRFRGATAAALGLNVTDTYALSNLNLLGPMTQTDLAARVGITRGSSTTMIDRLEAAGLARRTPHPTDRRSTVVELTDQARALLRASALRLAATVPDTDDAEATRLSELLESIASRMDLATTELQEGRLDPLSWDDAAPESQASSRSIGGSRNESSSTLKKNRSQG